MTIFVYIVLVNIYLKMFNKYSCIFMYCYVFFSIALLRPFGRLYECHRYLVHDKSRAYQGNYVLYFLSLLCQHFFQVICDVFSGLLLALCCDVYIYFYYIFIHNKLCII